MDRKEAKKTQQNVVTPSLPREWSHQLKAAELERGLPAVVKV